jgi:hypothetical protein
MGAHLLEHAVGVVRAAIEQHHPTIWHDRELWISKVYSGELDESDGAPGGVLCLREDSHLSLRAARVILTFTKGAVGATFELNEIGEGAVRSEVTDTDRLMLGVFTEEEREESCGSEERSHEDSSLDESARGARRRAILS